MNEDWVQLVILIKGEKMKKIDRSDLNVKQSRKIDEKSFYEPEKIFKTHRGSCGDKSEREWCMKIYIICAFLRVLLTVLPQPGYIHPDELIQSVEIIGGHVLNADVDVAWEFNRTNPIRSPNISFLIIGIPMWILKQISQLYEGYFGENLINPYTILVASRSILCVGSFLVDFSLYKICKLYCRPYERKISILASSYVMLVYGTRTFSNTIEMILFSVLLWMVAVCLHHHEALVQCRQYLFKITNGFSTPINRVKNLKVVRSIKDLNLHNCLLISNLIVVGCYNRPTFVLFGVGPLFFWIHRGLSSEFITVKDIHTRMFMFLLSAVPLITLLILIDSFYYGYLTVAEVQNFDISIKKFVFPPWNFVKFNIDSRNVAQFGVHGRYLHFLVNIPLLFGVLGVLMLLSWTTTFYRFVKSPEFQGHSRALDIDNLMRVSLAIPVGMLSLLPHQEPRFIIPVILPLIFLYGDQLYAKLFGLNLIRIWFLFNLVMTIVFGFVHQSSVYSFASHIHKELNQIPKNQTVYLYTSHMYTFPHVLLNQPNPNRVFRSLEGVKFQKRRQVFIDDKFSTPINHIVSAMNDVYVAHVNERNAPIYKIYVALPAAFQYQFEKMLRMRNFFQIADVYSSYPHLIMEIFAKQETYQNLLSSDGSFYEIIFSCIYKVFDWFTINIYRLEPVAYTL